jgi:hypothetical protein
MMTSSLPMLKDIISPGIENKGVATTLACFHSMETMDAVILVFGGPFLYQFSTLHGCTWHVDPLNTNVYIMRMLIIL